MPPYSSESDLTNAATLNSSATASLVRAVRGSLFFFLDDPGSDNDPVGSYQYYEDGILVLTDDGHIADIGSTTDMQSKYGFAIRDIIDHSGKLISRGLFTRMHIILNPKLSRHTAINLFNGWINMLFLSRQNLPIKITHVQSASFSSPSCYVMAPRRH